jgi:hypothetical protein
MNYDVAGEKYLAVRQQIDELERQHKEAKAELQEKLVMLENWFTMKAQEDGLLTVPTPAGLVYWSTHHSASVASREALFEYCKEHETWDLLEARASKTAVKSFIEAHGEPPPGVNFNSVSVFNFRKNKPKV